MADNHDEWTKTVSSDYGRFQIPLNFGRYQLIINHICVHIVGQKTQALRITEK